MAEGGVDPWLPNLTYRKAERQPNISALPLQQNFPSLWPHLPGLRGPPYQGGELVHAGIADLLRGGRAVEPEEHLRVTGCVLSASRADGILDGKEDGGAQEERRLPYRLSGQEQSTGRESGEGAASTTAGLETPGTPASTRPHRARQELKIKQGLSTV